jgi:hypothetical protein
MIECQVGYAVQCIQQLLKREVSWIDVRRDVMDRYNRNLQTALGKTAWTAGCSSWYKTASGKVVNNWSGFTLDYWRRTRRPNWHDYRIARPS